MNLTLSCIRCGVPERKANRRICAECYAVQNRAIMKKVGMRPGVKARNAAAYVVSRTDPKWRLRCLLSTAKASAKKRGLIFSLDSKWIAKQDLTKCAITEIPFDFGPTPGRAARHPWAPSLDRRDSSRGYTPDNVQIVCWAYNVAKHEYSAEVLLRLARAIVDAALKTGV